MSADCLFASLFMPVKQKQSDKQVDKHVKTDQNNNQKKGCWRRPQITKQILFSIYPILSSFGWWISWWSSHTSHTWYDKYAGYRFGTPYLPNDNRIAKFFVTLLFNKKKDNNKINCLRDPFNRTQCKRNNKLIKGSFWFDCLQSIAIDTIDTIVSCGLIQSFPIKCRLSDDAIDTELRCALWN